MANRPPRPSPFQPARSIVDRGVSWARVHGRSGCQAETGRTAVLLRGHAQESSCFRHLGPAVPDDLRGWQAKRMGRALGSMTAAGHGGCGIWCVLLRRRLAVPQLARTPASRTSDAPAIRPRPVLAMACRCQVNLRRTGAGPGCNATLGWARWDMEGGPRPAKVRRDGGQVAATGCYGLRVVGSRGSRGSMLAGPRERPRANAQNQKICT